MIGKYNVWAVLSAWFVMWFMIRLLGWSLGWFPDDWIWTSVYLVASIFCVCRYNYLKYPPKKEVN